MFVVYPVGVPTFAMWVFYKNWARLHGQQYAPIAKRQPSLPSSHTVEQLPWWYGDRSTFHFMVRDYRPGVFFFEIVDFVRKFALTGLLMFADRGSASQIVLGIMLAFGFGLLTSVVQPYADSPTNIFRITADCSLFITLLIVLVLHFKDEFNNLMISKGCEFLTLNILQWILVGVNFVVILVGASQELLRRLFKFYHQTNLVGILFNAHDKVLDGEGGYSTIYRGKYRASISAKAVPAAVKARAFDSEIEAVEVALMLECAAHPNIVKLFKSQQDGPTSYLAMELGDCSLESTISTVTAAGELDPITLCEAVTQGVQHLHQSGFVHGNVTPANIVLFGNTPKLCGFSCARALEPSIATEMSTVRGTRGYQPLEILARKYFVSTEVHDPEAVDVFGLGCTIFFILSGGDQAFIPSQGKQTTNNIELSILAGTSGLDTSSISAEGKHLLRQMLCAGPSDRVSLDVAVAHPLFWTIHQKLQYLGESVGNVLPPRIHKSENPFITDIERLLDNNIGPYDETDPENGGSWSRALDSRYPLTGDWGKKSGQRTPQEEERNYFIFGAPPSKKQAAERERQIQSGKMTATFAAKHIRSVGLLKFMRNIYAHRAQQVEAGRFETELVLCTWLLDPFPFLLMGVYEADQIHALTPLFATNDTIIDEQQPPQLDHMVNPLAPTLL